MNIRKIVGLFLFLFSVSAFSQVEPDVIVEAIGYKIIRKAEVEIVGYQPYLLSEKVALPSSILIEGKQYKVTSIGEFAFSSAGLKDVKVPESVRTIRKGAFYSCISLRKVDLPPFLERIDDEAFYDCKALQTVVLRRENPLALVFGEQVWGNVFNCRYQVPEKSLVTYRNRCSFMSENSNEITELK